MSQDPSVLLIPLGAPFFTAPDGTVVQDSGGTPIDLTGQKIGVAPVRQGDEASIVFADPALNRLLVIGLLNITPDDIGKTFIIRNASSKSPFVNPTPPPTIAFGETNDGIYLIIGRGTGFATETESVFVDRLAPIPTAASDVLTGTANFSDTETVTTGTKVYTFQTVLTNVDGNVLIGADLEASLQNLFDAINLSGTAGVQYATDMTNDTVPVVATANDATTLTVESKILGASGNEIAVSTTAADASWATPELAGGTGVAVFAPDPNNGNIEWFIVDPADFLEGDPLKALAERATELRINNASGPARFADFNPTQPPLVVNNSGGVFSKVQRS